MLARPRGGRWPFRVHPFLLMWAEVSGSSRFADQGIGSKPSLKLLKGWPPVCMRFNGFAACKKIGFIRQLFQRKPAQRHGQNNAVGFVGALKRDQFPLVAKKITVHRCAFNRVISIGTAFCIHGCAATECGEKQKVSCVHRRALVLKTKCSSEIATNPLTIPASAVD